MMLCARGNSTPCSRQITPSVEVTKRFAYWPPTARNRPSPNAIPPNGIATPNGPSASTFTLVQSAPLVDLSIVQTAPVPFVPTTNIPFPYAMSGLDQDSVAPPPVAAQSTPFDELNNV